MPKISLSPLDKLYSEFIRRRAMVRVNGCERCLAGKVSYKQLQASHFWGRAKRSTRFDISNGAGLCGGCHMFLSANPKIHLDWFKNHIGETEFDLLEARAFKPQKIDVEAVTLFLKEELARLPEEELND